VLQVKEDRKVARMADFNVVVFAADNFNNPQNPGFLPSEDATFLSNLVNGDQMTWLGGGESALVTITDNVNATFDEAQSNQVLQTGVTFDGVSYAAGQVVTPTYTLIFSGSDGSSYTLTSFNFSPNTNNEIPDGAFWESAIPPAGTVLTLTSEVNPTGANSRDYTEFVTCFCTGTLIETEFGPRAIEDLVPGDRVRCHDGRYVEVLMIPSREILSDELRKEPKLLPVKVSAGAFGHGLPASDTWVSRQHRYLVRSKVCDKMFQANEVLVSAIKLTEVPGIYVDESIDNVTYWHLVLPQHEIIFANSAPTESFLLAKGALKALSRDALEELHSIFPDLDELCKSNQKAMLIPTGKQQKKLIDRHVRNEKPLLEFA
jgi:hypothetical protein